MTLRKFLGFMVNRRGTEANPAKIYAIEDIPSPRSVKDVQKITGRLVALSRFLSKMGDIALPFFKILSWDSGGR